MSSCREELDIPPSRNHMGVVQIIELVLMGIVAILCIADLISQVNFGLKGWVILAIICDILFILGLIYIVIGLFCNFTSNKIRAGIFCFIGGVVIQLVFIFYRLFSGGRLVDWLLNLVKGIVLIFLCVILWRQSKNVEGTTSS